MVSVLMPVYNAEAFVEEAVRSVLTQTYPNLELIVIDDGSTDGSLVRLRALAATDPRMSVSSRENRGIAATHNEQIDLARGPLISLCDADDIVMPDCLERQVRHLAEHPEAGVVTVCAEHIDAAGGRQMAAELGEGPFSVMDLRLDRDVPGKNKGIYNPASMWRKDIVLRAGKLRAAFPVALDLDLFLRCNAISEVHRLNKYLLKYRIHANNLSGVDPMRLYVFSNLVKLSAAARRVGLDDSQLVRRLEVNKMPIVTFLDYYELFRDYPSLRSAVLLRMLRLDRGLPGGISSPAGIGRVIAGTMTWPPTRSKAADFWEGLRMLGAKLPGDGFEQVQGSVSMIRRAIRDTVRSYRAGPVGDHLRELAQFRRRAGEASIAEGVRSDVPVDVVLVVAAKDAETLPFNVEGIQRNLRHPLGSITILGQNNAALKALAVALGCTFVDENEVLPGMRAKIGYSYRDMDRSGWVLQQLLKCSGDRFAINDNYLVVDSDTVLVRPQVFMLGHKTVLLHSDEYNEPYFRANEVLLGMPAPYRLSTVAHMMLFNRTRLAALKEHMEARMGRPWQEAFTAAIQRDTGSGIAEYELYGQWLLTRHGDDVVREYWKGLSIDRRKLRPLPVLEDAFKERYRAVSFHCYVKYSKPVRV